jgi:lysine-N-methylase
MSPKFVVKEAQRYECRDCPARCCRVPWSIRFGPEETERFLADPWITLRVGEEGRRVLAKGMLPQREHERRLQCVFLDEDELCSLHKRYGHEYLPRGCQAFPFGFLQGGGNRVTPQLSLLCPSIRDNYGHPVKGQLPAKLKQRGEVDRTSTALSTTTGVILSRAQYLAIAGDWQQALAGDGSALDVLAHLVDRLDAFEQALPEGERAAEVAVKSARRKAAAVEPEPLPTLARPSFHARALYSYLLGNLSYPSRCASRNGSARRRCSRVCAAPATSWPGCAAAAPSTCCWCPVRCR